MNATTPELEVYDTTLRDGTQREGMNLSCREKLELARHMDRVGFGLIEGGWPGSNPKDVEFFERARELEWRSATIAAFGSTRRPRTRVENDPQVEALLDAGTAACTVFGKSWNVHVREVLRVSREENLRMIEETVAHLRRSKRRVIYDAEHFFDGWSADSSYALATLEAAAAGGADTLVLCDTNGGSLPWRVEEATRAARARLGAVRIGIHAHDDAGCGVANALAAVRAGARHVQGTVNGYGERCGNTNLCTLIPDLELKLGVRCLPEGSLSRLGDLSRAVARCADLAVDEHAPYVGRSAFAHKGGVHVGALRRLERAYEHCDPSAVGNRTRVVVSELSGRGNVLSKAEELRLDGACASSAVLARIKQAEARGHAYEDAEASFALLVEREADGYRAPFRVSDFRVSSTCKRGETDSEATVRVEVGGALVHTAATGCGPVNALDGALRRALEQRFPAVARIRLTDYRVRILDGMRGTAATTRVHVTFRADDRTWSTVGASPDILEASLAALTDGLEYGLTDRATPRTRTAS